MDEIFIQAMSLLLQQVRVTRRAMEDIERNTANYGGLSFTAAFAAGPRFGEPPMFGDALRVHVININDLAPGTGFAGLFQALLGGVGRFLGGGIGGVISSIITGWSLPGMIERVERIVQTVERIVTRLGLNLAPRPPNSAQTQTPTGPNLTANLDRIVDMTRAFTALFTAASNPDQAGQISPVPRTAEGQSWLTLLQAIQSVLTGVNHAINGLILLLPIAIGALAMLFHRIADIRLVILETLQFIVRNAFLLRGLVLVVAYETLASILRLGSGMLTLLGTAVDQILVAIFHAIDAVLQAAVAAIRLVGAGISNTVNQLLNWIVNGLGEVLRWVGTLRVFRVISHAILILPALLPPIYTLKTGNAMPAAEATRLGDAHTWATALQPLLAGTGGAPGASGGSPPVPPFTPLPNLADFLVPPAEVTALRTTISDTGTALRTDLSTIFSAGSTFLTGIASNFRSQADREAAFSNERINTQLQTLERRADELSAAITRTEAVARQRSSTGLEAIAQAYESWLQGRGMDTLLSRIGQHFDTVQAGTPEASRTLRLLRGEVDRPRATVEIQQVEITLQPPPAPPPPPPASTVPSMPTPDDDERIYLAMMRHVRELEQRGNIPLPDEDPFTPIPV